MIELKNISLAYESHHTILENISFTIEKGEFVSIIGLNGSGKTTLLNCIAGLLHPQTGDILLNGKHLNSYSIVERAKLMAYVPQEFQLVFPISVMDFVFLGRSHQSHFFQTPDDLNITRHWMEKLDVWEMKNKLFTELSSGEKQRVMIAKALVQEPRILLLDEFTSHVDLAHQITLFRLLKKMHSENNLTIISITHDLNFALGFSTTTIALADKKIIARGKTEKILNSEFIRSQFKIESDFVGKNVIFRLST